MNQEIETMPALCEGAAASHLRLAVSVDEAGEVGDQIITQPTSLCGYEIDPALKHCQEEIDAAVKAGDVEHVKRIIEREGLEWLSPQLPEKYRTDDGC